MTEIIDERKDTKGFIRNLKSGDCFCYKDQFFMIVYNTDYYEAVNLADGKPTEFDRDTYVDRISIKIIIQN